MEIKQGDKVRVRRDAQEIFMYGLNPLWFTEESTVVCAHPDVVVIKLDANNYLTTGLHIPTKYLIKVDAEAKEPKFKVGDKVVVHYSTGDRIGRIQEIMWDGTYDIDYGSGCTGHNITRSQIEPYTEPTEQTEAEEEMQHHKAFQQQMADTIAASKKRRAEFLKNMREVQDAHILHCEQIYTQSDFIKEYDPSKHEVSPKPRTIPKIMFNTEFWVKYEADLAKEIAVKVANKYSDPTEAAEYAVRVAKAVVKGLKRK